MLKRKMEHQVVLPSGWELFHPPATEGPDHLFLGAANNTLLVGMMVWVGQGVRVSKEKGRTHQSALAWPVRTGSPGGRRCRAVLIPAVLLCLSIHHSAWKNSSKVSWKDLSPQHHNSANMAMEMIFTKTRAFWRPRGSRMLKTRDLVLELH